MRWKKRKTTELTKKQERRPDVLLLSWHRLSLLFFLILLPAFPPLLFLSDD